MGQASHIPTLDRSLNVSGQILGGSNAQSGVLNKKHSTASLLNSVTGIQSMEKSRQDNNVSGLVSSYQ